MEVNETRTEPLADRGLGDDERHYEKPAAAGVVLVLLRRLFCGRGESENEQDRRYKIGDPRLQVVSPSVVFIA